MRGATARLAFNRRFASIVSIAISAPFRLVGSTIMCRHREQVGANVVDLTLGNPVAADASVSSFSADDIIRIHVRHATAATGTGIPGKAFGNSQRVNTPAYKLFQPFCAHIIMRMLSADWQHGC